jgi:hypothetical protein
MVLKGSWVVHKQSQYMPGVWRMPQYTDVRVRARVEHAGAGTFLHWDGLKWGHELTAPRHQTTRSDAQP